MAMVFCRGCGQQVDESATFCPHCGAAQKAEGNGLESVVQPKPVVDYGAALLAIPIIGTIIIALIVSQLNVLDSPDNVFSVLTLMAVIATAVVAALEASKVGMKSDRQKGLYKPPTWFIFIALLWIVAYPLYLYKRKHVGLPNRLAAGIGVICICFVGSVWILTNMEEQKTEVTKSLGLEAADVEVEPATVEASSEQGSAAFNCADQPELAITADVMIRHLDEVQPITADMKKTLGPDIQKSWIVSQKIPDKMVGMCIAMAYYYDNTSHPILYSVSMIKNDTEWFVIIHDFERLKAAMLLNHFKKENEEAAKQKAAAQAQAEQEAKEETDSAPHGVTNAAKDSLPPGLSLSEIKQQDTSSEQVKPSFSCEQATAKIDKMICKSPDLAGWDAKVFESYKEAMKTTNAAQTNQLVNSQKEWIKKRNQCGTNQCIADAYEQRDRELAPWDYE